MRNTSDVKIVTGCTFECDISIVDTAVKSKDIVKCYFITRCYLISWVRVSGNCT